MVMYTQVYGLRHLYDNDWMLNYENLWFDNDNAMYKMNLVPCCTWMDFQRVCSSRSPGHLH
mgnify:FL=1